MGFSQQDGGASHVKCRRGMGAGGDLRIARQMTRLPSQGRPREPCRYLLGAPTFQLSPSPNVDTDLCPGASGTQAHSVSRPGGQSEGVGPASGVCPLPCSGKVRGRDLSLCWGNRLTFLATAFNDLGLLVD